MRGSEQERNDTGDETASVYLSADEKATLLKAVADKHGGLLTAELVVQESDLTNRKGVAHKLASVVGWDKPDHEAARKWREERARAVIRSVEPELIRLGVLEIKAPYYVHDPQAGTARQSYVRLLSLKSEREVAEDALQAEIERAVTALERAYGVAAALNMKSASTDIFNALAALGRAPEMNSVVAGQSKSVRRGGSASAR